MFQFSCPSCKTVFRARDEQQDAKISCSKCGQHLKIPSPPRKSTVLAAVVPDGAAASAGFAPDGDDVPEVVAVVPPLTVRLYGTGLDSRKFKTTSPLPVVLNAVDDMICGLGLSRSDDGEVSGDLRHSYSFFTTLNVDGIAAARREKGEFVIDLSCNSRMALAAILISIFFFPLGLIVMLMLSTIAQSESKRYFADAFQSLKSRLDEG